MVIYRRQNKNFRNLFLIFLSAAITRTSPQVSVLWPTLRKFQFLTSESVWALFITLLKHMFLTHYKKFNFLLHAKFRKVLDALISLLGPRIFLFLADLLTFFIFCPGRDDFINEAGLLPHGNFLNYFFNILEIFQPPNFLEISLNLMKK